MDIITTARHFELTPGLKEHTQKRLEKLERFLGGVEEVYVILTTEKHRRIAEISLRARGTEIVGRDESDDMVTSIDRVVDRIERQLKRLHARRRDRGQRRSPKLAIVEESHATERRAEAETSAELDLSSYADEDFAPVVVRGNQYHPEPVTVEDAIRIMRERDEDLLLFTNVQTRRPAMVHLRPDGNYGLVEAN
ncbi:MAG: ribosome-associated translation inhibitor RaiA [Planctomycetes bacterium]|nr:ribosome-associated translation inhibitor RaiA [Planctomycetota bacterium]